MQAIIARQIVGGRLESSKPRTQSAIGILSAVASDCTLRSGRVGSALVGQRCGGGLRLLDGKGRCRVSKVKPTSITRRDGKRLRWAKNIVKKRERDNLGRFVILGMPEYKIAVACQAKRYERAVALIVAHRLSQ